MAEKLVAEDGATGKPIDGGEGDFGTVRDCGGARVAGLLEGWTWSRCLLLAEVAIHPHYSEWAPVKFVTVSATPLLAQADMRCV